MRKFLGLWVASLAILTAGSVYADFLQDFSVDTDGILDNGGGLTYNATPETATVGNGAGGVFTRFGGYNFGAGGGVPTTFQEYYTCIDIYLNIDGGWNNDTRFDWDSSINDAGGNFRRDYIFNAGFYNDATGPGANTNRFVISAGNNSQPGSAFAKNPGHDPIAISTTGWYTFEHHFYDNSGVLAVDMSIYDDSNALVHRWTLSDPSDLIASIGGNRYGWFDYNQFAALEIDNVKLNTAQPIPEPASVFILSLGIAGLAGIRRNRK